MDSTAPPLVQRTSVKDTREAFPLSDHNMFEYNDRRGVTESKRYEGPLGTESDEILAQRRECQFDFIGDRLGHTAGRSGTVSYTPDGFNRYDDVDPFISYEDRRLNGSNTGDSIYIYDANGQVLEWNAERIVMHYEYDPFGQPAAFSGAYSEENRFRFSTKYQDRISDLHYYGYRYYSPSMGRFLNRDPIEEEGGLNLYGFVGNDPVNKWDYLGLSYDCDKACDEAKRLKLVRENVIGAVVCCDGKKYSCAWSAGSGVTNSKAQEIIKGCILEHEDVHHDHGSCPCEGIELLRGPANLTDHDECHAYLQERSCLRMNIVFCRQDQECRNQVENALKGVERAIRRHCHGEK